MSRRFKFVALAAAVLLLAAGGVAYASIPAPDGVIHGCYKTSGPAQGAVIVIDSAASCPSGYAALNWSQTGPQGPAGTVPSGSVYDAVRWVGSFQTSTPPYTVSCPSDRVVISGSARAGDDIPLVTKPADSNSFRTTMDITVPASIPVGTYISWYMTCARVTA
jgi:hypothetical protein